MLLCSGAVLYVVRGACLWQFPRTILRFFILVVRSVIQSGPLLRHLNMHKWQSSMVAIVFLDIFYLMKFMVMIGKNS
jgi:hypothetical protein